MGIDVDARIGYGVLLTEELLEEDFDEGILDEKWEEFKKHKNNDDLNVPVDILYCGWERDTLILVVPDTIKYFDVGEVFSLIDITENTPNPQRIRDFIEFVEFLGIPINDSEPKWLITATYSN